MISGNTELGFKTYVSQEPGVSWPDPAPACRWSRPLHRRHSCLPWHYFPVVCHSPQPVEARGGKASHLQCCLAAAYRQAVFMRAPFCKSHWWVVLESKIIYVTFMERPRITGLQLSPCSILPISYISDICMPIEDISFPTSPSLETR